MTKSLLVPAFLALTLGASARAAEQPAPLQTIELRAGIVGPQSPTTTLNMTVDQCTRIDVLIETALENPPISIVCPNTVTITPSNVEQLGGFYVSLRPMGNSDSLLILHPAPVQDGYRLSFPTQGPGTYAISITAPAGTFEDHPVVTTVTTDSTLGATMIVGAGTFRSLIDPVAVSCLVFDGMAPWNTAQIVATLVKTDGALQQDVTLKDDGIDPDLQANDGAYTGLVDPLEAGEYVVGAEIQGVRASGASFSRSAASSFTVRTPNAAFFRGSTQQVSHTVGYVPHEDIGQLARAIEFEFLVVVAGSFAPGELLLDVEIEDAGKHRKSFSGTETEFQGGSQGLWYYRIRAVVDASDWLAWNTGPWTLARATLAQWDSDGYLVCDSEPLAESLSWLDLNAFSPRRIFAGSAITEKIILAGQPGEEDPPPDQNENIERLIIRVPIYVPLAAPYRCVAELIDGCGTRVAESTANVTASPGPNPTQVAFSFAGSDIGAKGIDGPYRLHNVRVLGQGSARLPVAYQTHAYQAEDFVAYAPYLDCNGNGIPDGCDIRSEWSSDLDLDGIPDECSDCPADIDGDGFLTGIDVDLFLTAFEAGDPLADFDGDGFVTNIDLDSFTYAFESGCS